MKLLIFTLLVFFSYAGQAQISDSLYKTLPDSLKPKNKTAFADKEKMAIILNVSQAFVQKNLEEIKAWTTGFENKIDQVKPVEEKIPYAQAIAGFYLQTGQVSPAFTWNKKLVTWGNGSRLHRQAISNAYMNLSINLSNESKMDSAVYMLQKAQDIAIADKDSASLKDTYYLNMIIYSNLYLYHEALNYLNKYLAALPKSEKWRDNYTSTMLTKGAIYSRLFRDELKTIYEDSCKLVIQEVMDAKKSEASIWYQSCYSTLGLLAFYKRDYKKAVEMFDLAALPEYNKPGSSLSERNYVEEVSRHLSALLAGDGSVLKQLLSISIPSGDFITQKYLNQGLYNYYVGKNDYKKALYYHTKYKVNSDSIDVIGQRGRIFEAEQKYSVAQKEVAIKDLETKNLQAEASKNRVVTVGVVFLLVLTILALLLYLANKRQQALRLAERQKLIDNLAKLEQELELDRIRKQSEIDEAIKGQRKAISKNMHDEVSSGLAALRYFVNDWKGKAKSEETRIAMAEVENETEIVYQQSRDFLYQLQDIKPAENLNAINLVENLSLRFGADSSLQITSNLDLSLENKLTAQQNTELYKVVKEAVANCLKHSGASRMEISILEEQESVVFDIKDNGKGFQEGGSGGLGMITMRERIESLGGEIDIKPLVSGLHIHGTFPKAA